MKITDEMCRRAVNKWAAGHDRIQGFSTRVEMTGSRPTFGAPHYIRDVNLPADKQEIWRGNSHDGMMDRCDIERMRLALAAALTD